MQLEASSPEPHDVPVDVPVDEHSDDGTAVGILTSGGDSQGMNAAIRAVVRTTLRLGGRPYAVREGWAGAVAGGDSIRALGWNDVSGVLHLGGTILGSARCPEFRTRDGLLAAAGNLVRRGIDRLVVIGGDGSLRGAEEFRELWPSLLEDLVRAGEIREGQRQAHPRLTVAGLVGSIDNDMAGTDMTIGADSALNRIIEAVDALRSTAASHQRTFVVEVMGRHCGYLALMAAVAAGADAVLVPEDPPEEGWQDDLVNRLLASRKAGLRDLFVIVAEGATDRSGRPITSSAVGDMITERLGGEGARVTILGHVQRGGRPSAYDRWMPTLLGYAAAQWVLQADGEPSTIVGVRHNRMSMLPLREAVAQTNSIQEALASSDYDVALRARGGSFTTLSTSFDQLCCPPGHRDVTHEQVLVVGDAQTRQETGRLPGDQVEDRPARRIAVLHVGGLAPGMNAAVRAIVRTAAVAGDTVLGVHGSVPGLMAGAMRELTWAEVDDWVALAGAKLGTRRMIPDTEHLPPIAGAIAENRIDAVVLIGGTEAYRTAAALHTHAAQEAHPELRVPVVCVPATIDNNLPGAELSIGADTALDTIVEALDKVRMTGSATRRCFVAETMGGPSGYLAMMAGLASGAERVYLPEERITIADLAADAARMTHAFQHGRQQWLAIRGEQASEYYTGELMARIFEEEGGDLFDVRRLVLGHVQNGGDPTPYDRLLATRLARAALEEVDRQLTAGEAGGCYLGEVCGQTLVTPIERFEEQLDGRADRPKAQWWLGLRPVGSAVNDKYATAEVTRLPEAPRT